MFFDPQGPTLTTEQVIELDDDFFGSDPVGYLHSRVEGLTLERDDSRPLSDVGRALQTLLVPLPELLAVSERGRALQVSIDSFSLRHHTAECLVRLYLAAATHGGGRDESVWLSIADGPTSTKRLVERARELLSSQASRTSFWCLVLGEEEARQDTDAATKAVNVCARWLERAMDLLVASDLDLNAGHNKVKHGLAIRPRDDLATAFTITPPDPDGTLSKDAFTGGAGAALLNRDTMQFLSRPPSQGSGRAHLELTIVQLAPEKLLAEVMLMTSVIGALFFHARLAHLARHGEHSTRRGSPAPGQHPQLALGPTPSELLGNAFVGQRSPVTTRPDGTGGRRAALVFEQSVSELGVNVANRMRGVTLRD